MAGKIELTSLTNLGLHLAAGAGDGYLTRAQDILHENKGQDVQTSLDALFRAVGNSAKGAVTKIEVGTDPNNIKVTYADGSSEQVKTIDIVNNLTSDSPTNPLAAAQGKVLKGAIDTEVQNRTKAIAALKFTDTEKDGQFIVAVNEVGGIISVQRKQVAADKVSFASDTVTGATNVKTAIEAVNTKATAGSKVKIIEAVGTEGNILKTYTVTQGGEQIGIISIAKDLVVSSGSVVKGNWSEGVFTEDAEVGTGTALKLMIANQAAPVYINTKDLVKDVTAGNGISISGNDASNAIAIKIASSSESFLTVGPEGLKLAGVQNAINAAKNEAVAHTVNGKKISTNPVLAAGDILKADGRTTIEADLAALHAQDGTLQGNINSAKSELLGTAQDASSKNTIYGAKKYADEKAAAAERNAKADTASKIAKEVNDRNAAISAAIKTSESNAVHYYKQDVTEGQSVSIAAATHKCGLMPHVAVYDPNGAMVICDVAIDSVGAITVSWSGSITKLSIVVIGQ